MQTVCIPSREARRSGRRLSILNEHSSRNPPASAQPPCCCGEDRGPLLWFAAVTCHVLCLPSLRNKREGAGGRQGVALLRLPEKQTPVRPRQEHSEAKEGRKDGERERGMEGKKEKKKETDSLNYPRSVLLELLLTVIRMPDCTRLFPSSLNYPQIKTFAFYIANS